MNKYERWTNCKKSGPLRVRLSTEKNNKTRTSKVGAISKAQKAQKNFFWKKTWIFEKKIFRKKVAQCRKYPLGTLRWYKNYFCASILILLSKNCKILKIVRIVRKVDHSEWDCQLKKTKKKKKKLLTVRVGHFSLEKRRLKKKKLLTVRVGLFSLREKAPTKK